MNSTPESLREIWQSWGIRGFIILSISLQIFLFLASSLRRKTGNMVVYFLIWSAYLLADWVPTFTTGLILKGLSTNASCATSTTGPGRSDNLLAIWAASLLGHLGGNFTVTVFSLEDNELWFRHPVVLVVQFGTAFYVFLCSLPHNKFLLPTIFILVSGLISLLCGYIQCIMQAWISTGKTSSENHIGWTMTGQNVCLEELHNRSPQDPLRGVNMLLIAHHYFKVFKGLIVNTKCKPHEQQEIGDVFCHKISSDEAYQLILYELNYMYDELVLHWPCRVHRKDRYCWLGDILHFEHSCTESICPCWEARFSSCWYQNLQCLVYCVLCAAFGCRL